MTQQMTEAMKSAKTIQQEMTQWENRLENLKNEGENLKRQNDILQQEIDVKRTQYAGYIAEKDKSLRDGFSELANHNKVLESQRSEFAGILDAHQQEKSKLAKERSDFEKEKSAILGQKALVDNFIQAVRRAYTLIS